jgi:hypothetical protein
VKNERKNKLYGRDLSKNKKSQPLKLTFKDCGVFLA